MELRGLKGRALLRRLDVAGEIVVARWLSVRSNVPPSSWVQLPCLGDGELGSGCCRSVTATWLLPTLFGFLLT
jgi:hypothetical protein